MPPGNGMSPRVTSWLVDHPFQAALDSVRSVGEPHGRPRLRGGGADDDVSGDTEPSGQIAGDSTAASGVIENSPIRHDEAVGRDGRTTPACLIKTLPPGTRERAAQLATRINPVNAPLYEVLGGPVSAGSPFDLTLTT